MKLVAHPTRKGVFVTPEGRVFIEPPAALSSGGYHTVKLEGKSVRRHTLMAETFIGPRPFPRAEVRHLDGDPGNDAPGNLAWGTKQQNGEDMVRHGRSTRGTRNAAHKITEAEAGEIKRRRGAGESGRMLAEEFNINESTVCDIHRGRTWGWI